MVFYCNSESPQKVQQRIQLQKGSALAALHMFNAASQAHFAGRRLAREADDEGGSGVFRDDRLVHAIKVKSKDRLWLICLFMQHSIKIELAPSVGARGCGSPVDSFAGYTFKPAGSAIDPVLPAEFEYTRGHGFPIAFVVSE